MGGQRVGRGAREETQSTVHAIISTDSALGGTRDVSTKALHGGGGRRVESSSDGSASHENIFPRHDTYELTETTFDFHGDDRLVFGPMADDGEMPDLLLPEVTDTVPHTTERTGATTPSNAAETTHELISKLLEDSEELRGTLRDPTFARPGAVDGGERPHTFEMTLTGQQCIPEDVQRLYPAVFRGDPRLAMDIPAQVVLPLPGERRKISRRPLAARKKQALLHQLQDYVEAGWLVPCGVSHGAVYAAPIHAVPKTGNTYRITWDFRSHNRYVQPEHYPMPLPLLDLQTSMEGMRWFGKADLSRAYWQIPIAEESRREIAVRVDDRLFFLTRLPQGLKISTAVCQRVLTAILRGEGGDPCGSRMASGGAAETTTASSWKNARGGLC